MSSERFARFLSPEPNTGCVLWTGATQSKGYGSFGVGTSKSALAHRVAWELERGPIPAGMTIDHLCGVLTCQNTAHMEIVTRAENARRQGARQTHCKRGHVLPMERNNQGRRACGDCRRAA